MEKIETIENRTALEMAFFLGAVAMLDEMYKDNLMDEHQYRRYVCDVCDSNAPRVDRAQFDEFVMKRLSSPSREWVNDWYCRRVQMS